MAFTREQYALPEPILAPGTKKFLERFPLGRLGLRVGRAIRPFARKFCDPMQQRVWARQFVFPLRNAALWNRPVSVSFGGDAIRLVPQGSAAGDFWTNLRKEQPEESFVFSLLGPGMVFFDVGANAGLCTIAAAKKIGAKGVFAFEPCSSTFRLLQRNLSLNRFGDVRAQRIALGDSAGEGVLQLHNRGEDGLNALGDPTRPNEPEIRWERVPLSTVDACANEQGVQRVDILKIDVQGAELMVLRGAQNLLERADAPMVWSAGCGDLTRRFGYHPVEILWFLESCGYTLFSWNRETKAFLEIKPDYSYDSAVIAAKLGHPAYARLQASVK